MAITELDNSSLISLPAEEGSNAESDLLSEQNLLPESVGLTTALAEDLPLLESTSVLEVGTIDTSLDISNETLSVTAAGLSAEDAEDLASVLPSVAPATASDSLLATGERENPFDGIPGTSVKAGEVDLIRNLTRNDLATVVATQNGNFSDPATFGGSLPADGARIIIPAGITVTYDVAGNNVPRIDTLRIDGTLEFATNRDTHLIVDLFVVEDGGTLRIGTEANPIRANVDARITFDAADPTNREIDLTRDPKQVGRGLIALPGSTTDIRGTDRTDFVALAEGAQAGDTTLRFDSVPADFQVGDRLVLSGTEFNRRGSNEDNSRFQDEELRITGIDRRNNTITFEQLDIGGNRLRFDHETPEGFDLNIYVANLTRNVTFESHSGEDTPLSERGHTLFLDQDLRLFNAGFDHLGRFNNDVLVDNPEFDADGNLIPGTGTNRNGRIPVYIADTLVTGSYSDAAAIISGNAVNGSASWSFAAATSRVTFENNVSFDVVGAHFVTRDGDEIAIFRDNIAIKATGAQTDPAADLLQLDRNERGRRRDVAVRGFGFWFDSSYSATEVTGNIVTSTEAAAYLYYGQNDRERVNSQFNVNSAGLVDVPTSSLPSHLQSLDVNNDGLIPAWQVPNQSENAWSDNTAYNNNIVLEIRGFRRDDSGFDQFRFGSSPDVVGEFRDFTGWGIREAGVEISYAASIQIEDFLLVGNPENPIGRDPRRNPTQGHGIFLSTNARGTTLINNHVEGFGAAINTQQNNNQSLALDSEINIDPLGPGRIIGGTFANNRVTFEGPNGRVGNGPRFDRIVENGPFNPFLEVSGNLNIEPTVGNQGPVANFTAAVASGSLTVDFDGSDSFDPDYDVQAAGENDNSIVSYAWDFDSDGTIDDFGFRTSFTYDTAGTYTATLLVLDSQGATATQEVVVEVGGQGSTFTPSGPSTPTTPGTSVSEPAPTITPAPTPAASPAPTPATSPAPTPITEDSVAIGLFDAESDTLIASLSDGATVNLSQIEGRNLTISATVPGDSLLSGQVESASLNLNAGQFTRTESVEPYALFGDSDGDFDGAADILNAGNNTLSLELFSRDGLRGASLAQVDLDFTVVDDTAPAAPAAASGAADTTELTAEAAPADATPVPVTTNSPAGATEPAVESPIEIGLFDADSNTLIASLSDGATVNLSQIEGRNLTIVATASEESGLSGQIRRAFLDLNSGQFTRADGVEPYALFGDGLANNLATGNNTLSVGFFDRHRITGDPLAQTDLNFTVVDDTAPGAPVVANASVGTTEGQTVPVGATVGSTNNVAAAEPEFVAPEFSQTRLDFFGRSVGTELSSTFSLANIPSGGAELSVTAFDIDAAAEAQLLVNGQLLDLLPAELLSDGDTSTATVFVAADLLQEGENELTFVFASDLNGTTGGYRIENLSLAALEATGTADAAPVPVTANSPAGATASAVESPIEIGLFDADSNTLIASLSDGATINLSQIEGRNLTIVATASEESGLSGQIRRAFLDLNSGQFTRADGVEPYALFGDGLANNLATGNNTLSVGFFDRHRITGDPLAQTDLNFTVVDDTNN